MNSVTDTVQMFAVRKVGKNVPFTRFTYFVEEVEEWMSPGCEMVIVHIKPYKEENLLVTKFADVT